MAVVTVRRPAALSLVGNMEDFVLQNAAGAGIPFVLKTGSETVFDGMLYPGSGSLVRFNAREMCAKYLSTEIIAANSGTQPNLARDFTATYDGQNYTFRVVGAGVDKLAGGEEAAREFLRVNFLTWQPQIKEVTYYSPEYITYYAVEACNVKMRAYMPDGTTQTLTLLSIPSGQAMTVNTQYAVIAGRLGNKYPGAYDVWTETTAGTRMSYVQRYEASERKSLTEGWFLFVNSLGGIDCIRAYGEHANEPVYEHQLAELDDVAEEFRVDTSRLYRRNTGRLSKEEARWMQDFFPSRRKYHHTQTGLRAIVVTESDAGWTTAEMGDVAYTFTYRYADAGPYLNIPRVADLPADLVIPSPSTGDLFFLPPRLAEFTKYTLDDHLLLPTNDPHDDKWGAIPVGEIKNGILNALVNQLEGIDMSGGGSGGGGSIYLIKEVDITAPTDENAFSALRTLKEIKNGTDSIMEDAKRMFLRKDIDDTAAGVISFKQEIRSERFKDGYDDGFGWMTTASGNMWMDGIQVRKHLLFGQRIGSPEFISGFPYGLGTDLSSYKRTNAAGIDETKWRLEIDDIIVRGKLRVFEFVVSQLRGENDNVIFAGMMKVDHYDPSTGILWLQTDEGVLYNTFREGDILMMQRYGGLPSAENQYNVIKQYELRVEEVGVGNLADGKERLDWIRFSNFAGDLGDIAENDVLTRVDSVTDSTRKGIVKITTIDEVGAPYIDVVYGMKTNPDRPVKARLGNLTGIRTLNNQDLTGLWGLYAEGAVLENSQIYLDNGLTIEQNFTIINGQFQSDIASVKDLVAAGEGNVLKNSQFTRDTWYWENGNDVSVFRVGETMLWFNKAYFADKRKVADIYTDGNRKVLRLKYTYVQQEEKWYNFWDREIDPENPDIYTIRFNYKALTAGTLKVGIADTELYEEFTMSPSSDYSTRTISGKWDGTGTFRIETTGEVLISNLTLYNDELTNLEVRLQTQITQNNEMIQLRATKDYVDASDNAILIAMEGKFTVTAGQISAAVTRINNVENTIATAGWITTADGNYLYARKDNIISTINQSPESISISASKINLNGQVTFSMFNQSTQNIINGKADTSSLGSLAYASLVAKNQLAAALANEITGKLNASDLPSGSLAYKTMVGKAQLDSTIISGGHIITSLIDTDAIYANMASIGGFTIENNCLRSDNKYTTGDSNTSFFLYSSGSDAFIGFSSTGKWAGIGLNVLPASVGAEALGRFEHTKSNIYGVNYGLSVSVANAGSNYGITVSAKNAQNGYASNYAICMLGGFVSGFAVKPRQIVATTYLNHEDVYVTCYNTTAINVFLPSNPEPGKLVFIRKMNTSQVTVYGNGKSIHNHMSNIVSSITYGNDGYTGMFFYDGQYWCYTYLIRNT